jgi:chromosome segregation ATPase
VKGDAPTGRLQSTLDDLKRRLQQEREASESLTHTLTAQRDQARAAEQSRVRKLESELAGMMRQWAEQKAHTERMAQQLADERGAAESRIREIEEVLASIESRYQGERAAAEDLVRQLAGERDGLRQELSMAEARISSLEVDLAALQSRLDVLPHSSEELESRVDGLQEKPPIFEDQLREQREASAHAIRQVETERDEARAKWTELEARNQWLEEELAAAQEMLLDAVRAMQTHSQNLLEQIRSRSIGGPPDDSQQELAYPPPADAA